MNGPAAHLTIPIAPAPEEVALYEIRKKIYPRAVSGVFARWRWAPGILRPSSIFYGLPWLSWNGRQAVLFDLGARKFYIFGLVFWPQDLIYLAVLLILSALALFLFTAVAGRLWCGYACPQTVYTEIFQWIERKIEGDRAGPHPAGRRAAIAREVRHQGAQARRVARRCAVDRLHVRRLLRADPRPRRARRSAWQLGPWESFWILFYGFATYGNAGWMREQVCKYMCPYARFQSVMFDRDTLVITYDAERGEPRGSRAKAVDRATKGLGDCVDCNICVQVCPTGIDIRKGLQYECIGCAACIDGCNQVMDKMGYPHGLIRYTTENALANRLDTTHDVAARVAPANDALQRGPAGGRRRRGGSLALSNPLKVDVIRDRGALARESAPGSSRTCTGCS